MPKHIPGAGVRILAVRARGLAARAGLRPGDRLVRLNGHWLRDHIDFHVYAGAEQLAIEFERGGTARTVRVRRQWGHDLGVECESPRPSEISTCANKCVFCFIHQLPKGLRKSLYVKDDDYRLSFLHGNYITLTDLPDGELQRIIDQQLSPLYVSVHATDPALRRLLLGSPKAIDGDLLGRLRQLARGGIRIHAQIVLCPGLNDGVHLERSVRELARLHPAVATVAVVPVGLTRHRDGLYPLRAVTTEEARAILEAIHRWQVEFGRTLGTRLVFGADELYLMAGEPIPPASAYEGFPVLEDGIGLVRRFEDEFRETLGRGARTVSRPRAVTVVTGELFAPILGPLLATVRVHGLELDVVAVANEFFGRAISVAGLLTGRDIIHALAGRRLGDAVLVPSVALREAGGVFLDDVSLQDLTDHLGVPVVAPEATARSLLDTLLASSRQAGE